MASRDRRAARRAGAATCAKLHPYGVYDRVEFKECIRTGCDTFDRYMVRMDEIRESLHILGASCR